MKAMENERLYLESLPPQAWELAKSQMSALMIVNPADFLTKVHSPVLALFGERDTFIPVHKSIILYKRFLKAAGNENVTIRIFPDADHGIQVNGEFAPGYFETMNNWLLELSQ